MITLEQRFGGIPAWEDVNEWLISLGWNRTVVGSSVQGRDLVVYAMSLSAAIHTTATADVNMMYLSLTHGNEPMGLVSLLATAQELSRRWQLEQERQKQYSNVPSTTCKILLFPFVNIDAYQHNFHNGTQQRGNLNGMDLNRNYANSWYERQQQQQPILPSTEPYNRPHVSFTEPESRTVRSVVEMYNITHAMSFHSMGHSKRPRLLIHPFASERPWHEMPPDRARYYRHASCTLNDKGHYDAAGTAMEAIGYTALGATIDWMDAEHNIYAFVVEAVPPCSSRFCRNESTQIWKEANINAQTAVRFLDLAADTAWIPQNQVNIFTSSCRIKDVVLLWVRSDYPSSFEMSYNNIVIQSLLMLFVLVIVLCHRTRRCQQRRTINALRAN